MSESNSYLLRTARDDFDITQEDLAVATTLSPKTISRAEKGEPISFVAATLICEYFSEQYHHKVTPEELGLKIQRRGRNITDRGHAGEETTFPPQNTNSQGSQPFQAAAIPQEDTYPPIAENLSSASTTQSYDILCNYLQQEQARILNALVPGSTNLWVRDIINNGLFIPPPWKIVQGTAPSTNLIEHLIDMLLSGQRILLLGDAGQGKTTVLKLILNHLIERFLTHPGSTNPLPIYIPLRDFPSLRGNALELLWTYLEDMFPLPFKDFTSLLKNNQVIFLFDGFDEIKGELTQRSLNERAASKVFACSSILSCRKSFFEFYLSMSPLQEHYPYWVELQSLTLTRPVIEYIGAFYQHKQSKVPQKDSASSERLIKTIQENQDLQDLARRPLLLVMMLDLFTDPRENGEGSWSVTKLYGKYIEKWLKNEAAKPDSLLRWNEKTKLLQNVAWFTYTTKASFSSPSRLNQSETFLQSELSLIVKTTIHDYSSVTETQLLDELCFRTLLAVSEGESYYFLHKSFHEYFVAKYIFEHLRTRTRNREVLVGDILQEVLPFEVVTFLKEMLEAKEMARHEKDLIVNNLIMVYQRYNENDIRSHTIRQHASHYLTRLGTPSAIQFLEQAFRSEPNKWVQRGIMVGLALYCERADVLEQYLTMIKNDPEVASINIGYHLVYYGDQAQEYGYYDQGDARCDGTLRSLFRHLSSERYKNSWALDLLTLSGLLETRGIAILSAYKQQISHLKSFLEKDHQGENAIFQQEKERLKELLQGAAEWI